jgi:predicted ATPase
MQQPKIMPLPQQEHAYKHNLPIQPTSLIGRDQDVDAVLQLLRRPDVRLLTLTGTPGIGKTRLALQVATELLPDFADGVYFVPLAPISDPELVAPTIAQTLGLKEIPNQSFFELLKTSLQDKPLLLLLDNFEQILPASSLLADLLSACPHLKMLVTSREVLHLRAEHQFPVPPLALADPRHITDTASLSQYAAVELFLQRAQAVRPDFQVTPANGRTVAEICVRLDGLPLAIELAAARIKLLSPQALLARLSRRLQILIGGARDLPERQQTLRKTIQWSYDLLNTEEQRLFRLLSVFMGGCTLEAVGAVCKTLGDGAMNVEEEVLSLLDKSLLQQREQTDGEQRFFMLEMIREFGLEYLKAGREEEIARRAHAEHYLALAEEAEPELKGARQIMWLERLEREHDNLREALVWAVQREETALVLRLSVAQTRFWQVRGHLSEGRGWLEQGLTLSKEVEKSLRARALCHAAELASPQGDDDEALALCRQSLTLFQQLEDPHGVAASHNTLGKVTRVRGDYAAAQRLLEKSLTLSREVGDRQAMAQASVYLALGMSERGDYTTARDPYAESLSIYQEMGDLWNCAEVLISLARTMDYLGNTETARVRAEEGLAICRKLGNRVSFTYIRGLLFLGTLAFTRSDYATAWSLAEEHLLLSRELGDKEGIARAVTSMGRVALYRADYVTARPLLEEALALFRELRYPKNIGYTLADLGRTFLYQGDYAAALPFLQENLEIARELADQRSIAYALGFLGQAAFYQGNYPQARRFLEESLAIDRETGDRLGTARRLCDLGRVSFSQGNTLAAQAHYEKALTICMELDSKWFVAACLEGLAAVMVAQGQLGRAARLWGAAEALREFIGASMPPVDHPLFERMVNTARSTWRRSLCTSLERGTYHDSMAGPRCSGTGDSLHTNRTVGVIAYKVGTFPTR